jgi:hypothetical protein
VSATTNLEFGAEKENGKSEKKLMCDNQKENHK